MTDQKNQGQIELEGTTARPRRVLRKPRRGQEGSQQGGFVGSLMMVLWMSGFCGGVGLLVPDEFKVEGFVVEGGSGRRMSSKLRVSWWVEAVGGRVTVTMGRSRTKGEWVWVKEREGGGRKWDPNGILGVVKKIIK